MKQHVEQRIERMYRRTVGLVKRAFKSELPDREAFRQIRRQWKRMWKVAERVGGLTGLNNQRVTLVADEGMEIVVRDDQGRKWRLMHWQVTAGHEYQAKNGKWYPEWLPAVRKALRAEIDRLRVEMEAEADSTKAQMRQDAIGVIEEVLARHSD